MMRYRSNLILPLLLILTACAPNIASRIKAADDIALKNNFNKQVIKAGNFALTVYSRVVDQNLPYAFYLAKDGYIQDKYGPSENPTPIKQMLFHLAALDTKRNVVYIARPCQYTDFTMDPSCHTNVYWLNKRLAPEVVFAANEVIKHFTNKPFSLIGHSGGGSLAVLVASENKNAQNIITIAANLDLISFNEIHHTQNTMTGSLNPIDFVTKVADIPQLHIAGGKDKSVPPIVIEKYVKAANSSCVQMKIIPNASHNDGWQTIWPQILATPLTCTTN